MRDADKIKTKMTVSLDGHQIGYLVFGGLVVAGLVFAAGFIVGQRTAPPDRPQALAEVACLEVLDDAGASSVSAIAAPMPALDYEERLRAPVPPVAPEDPALRLLAEERADLALPGEEPEPPDIPVMPNAAPFGEVETVDLPPDPPAPKAAAAAAPVRAAAPAAARAPERETRSKAEDGAKKTRFTLQVQAFRNKPEAESFARDLRGRGHSPYVVESRVPGRGRWFRVRVGKFDDQSGALAFQKRFEKTEGIDTFVTPVN